jgi:hypothetical protein
MRRTVGIMRLTSRWFFEPTIFLMMKLIIAKAGLVGRQTC